MSIKRIKACNFKSFDELDVELRPFNLVVGANAAGKSNFLEIFRFWRDLTMEGLQNAVALQGGATYLANLGKMTAPVALELESQSLSEQIVSVMEADFSSMGAIRATVIDRLDQITLQADDSGFKAALTHSRTDLHCRLDIGSPQGFWSGHLIDSMSPQGNSTIVLADESVDEETRNLLAGFQQLFSSLFRYGDLTRVAMFDFDRHLLQGPQANRGRVRLESDGGNLAIALRHLLQSAEKKEALLRLTRDLLPFAEDLRIEELTDRSLQVILAERFSDLRFVPASLLSAGTVRILALLVALFFDELAPITIIEEPENGLHPHLISKMVGLMKEAAREKQIIVTTHNPQLLRYVELEDILLVQRDHAGFSRISRPADSEEVRTFVENDLGADELFVQNLLGVGNEV
jgi:predicted ATPase